AHVLREFDVAADEDADLEPIELDDLRQGRTGGKGGAVDLSEQMRLSVRRGDASGAVDQLRGVIDVPAGAALRIAVEDGDAGLARDAHDGLRRGAVRRFRQAARRAGTDVVAGQGHPRT